MSPMVPLPQAIQARLGKNTHPGLALDKYAASWNAGSKWQEGVQKPVCEVVRKLSVPPDALTFDALRARRDSGLRCLAAETFSAMTAGPLTLHLARASVLENAGICLHPLYGFTYLPGSGLKGMARAWAETVWCPAQSGKADAWRQIEAVFGWAPGSDKGKPWKPPDARNPEGPASAGSIVFHDAWPQEWPRLVVDIVNCHHPKYYQDSKAPGDWENPVPVYFLAVPPGVTFSFALSKVRADAPGGCLELARQWLVGALQHAGSGAKTAAGYGTFRLVAESEADNRSSERVREVWTGALDAGTRAEFTAELELVSPAFLAGASQQQEDCDLRPATLRGLLRGWWRTLHAAHVDVATLRKMEAAIWGDTAQGGAVTIRVRREGDWKPVLYDKGSKVFLRPQEKGTDLGIQGCDPSKTTYGLWYASYGMDMKNGRRYYAPPGATWTVSLLVRPYTPRERKPDSDERIFPPDRIKADLLLDQAKAALWLLCHFGGVGSKARKGFGSFADIAAMTLDGCLRAAKAFRGACAVSETTVPDPESPALEHMLGPVEVTTPWKNPWFVLDQVGFSMQAFAQADRATGHGKHCESKRALGLPRNIDRPARPLSGPKGSRHASPVHYHLGKKSDGTLVIRVLAFPAPYLPDTPTIPADYVPDSAASRRFLQGLLDHLKQDLERRARENPEREPLLKPTHAGMAGSARGAPMETPAGPYRSGDRVKAVLLEGRAKGGQWKARTEDKLLSGHITNSPDVPADNKAGDAVVLIVGTPNGANSSFRWPTSAHERSAKKPATHQRPGMPGGRHSDFRDRGGFRGGGGRRSGPGRGS